MSTTQSTKRSGVGVDEGTAQGGKKEELSQERTEKLPRQRIKIMVWVQGRTQDFRGGGKIRQANKQTKRVTELKPPTCAHQGSMFRPY